MLRALAIHISAFALLVPAIAGAANAPSNFKDLVGIFLNLIKIVVYIVFALTFLAFLWGVTKSWVMNGGDAGSIEDGKKIVMVSIIALVIMVSVWGIVSLLQASFFG